MTAMPGAQGTGRGARARPERLDGGGLLSEGVLEVLLGPQDK
jgi:hypothetical protein